jgi:hypothetical protein
MSGFGAIMGQSFIVKFASPVGVSALSESDPVVFLRSSPPKEQALESNL